MKKMRQYSIVYHLGGGSGAGVSINPVAFLVVQQNNVKLLPVSHTSVIDKLLDYVPDLMEKANGIINKNMQNKKEEKKEEKQETKEKIKEEKVREQNPYEANPIPKAKVKRAKRPTTVIEYEYDETDEPLMQMENLEEYTDEDTE